MKGCLPRVMRWCIKHPLLTLVIVIAVIVFGAVGNAAQGASVSPQPTVTVDTQATQDAQSAQFDNNLATQAAETPYTQPSVLPPTTVIQQTPTAVVHATPRPIVTPKPQPTQPPAPTCQAVNNNPWCYNFTAGSLIYSPQAAFCDYFSCVSTFWVDTNGYVAECGNGKYTHSDGVSGACSRDGGILRVLYSH